MTLALIILADGPSADLVAQLGPASSALYAHLLGDTATVAGRLPGAQVMVRHSPNLAPEALACLPPGTSVMKAPVAGAKAVGDALAKGLAGGGPAIVIGGNLPHLPLWRLRDAATYLNGAADVVVGPSDSGSWYLIGLSAAAASLVGQVPARGAPIGGLVAAGAGGHVVHLLPPWFGISTVADLASLADTLRTMPRDVAVATRAMLEMGQASRAVGG